MSAPQALVVDPERTFLDNLAVIDRVIDIIVRRHVLARADKDEFTSRAHAHIIEENYAVLRKFGGKSSLATYLSVVLGNLFVDYRNSTWGRWRPSAAAQRLGPMGIRLEELLYREGHSLREANQVLQSAGVALTDTEISQMAAKIPPRERASEVPLEKADTGEVIDVKPNVSAASVDPDVLAVLRAAMAQLPSEEQVILRMHFWDGLTVADVSRTLHVDQKALYRTIGSIQKGLREKLAAHGIDEARVADALAGEPIW
jgi:RNA polymerase sigma factor for flagellar operon FliA